MKIEVDKIIDPIPASDGAGVKLKRSQGQNHDESACDDCCCVHSHLMVNLVTPTKISLNFNKQIIIASADHHHSIDLSGLKRPPRL